LATTKQGSRRRPQAVGRAQTAGLIGDLKGIPERLAGVEAALKQVLRAVGPPSKHDRDRTRLLIPFVTNALGFDTGVAISNTGQDSSGVIGKAGILTIHYFGVVGGNPPTRLTESTNRPVAVGETVAFTLSIGGGLGLGGNPGFQGYVEVDCHFPFAHGVAFFTDGPIGVGRVGVAIPVLVLPTSRTASRTESLGE
jgi:hypothetical protein